MTRGNKKFSLGCLVNYGHVYWERVYLESVYWGLVSFTKPHLSGASFFKLSHFNMTPCIFVFSFFFFSLLECVFFNAELRAVSLSLSWDSSPQMTSASKNNIPAGEAHPAQIILINQTHDAEPRFPDEPPLEPQDYRHQDYRGMVPTSLKGAAVVDARQAEVLYRKGNVIFIDVMPYTPKPPNLPKTMIWRDKIHKNIEGSFWLANVGYGALPPKMDKYFKLNLKKLTKGDHSQALLFYCQANCWMSWNAAKRALEYGYHSVYWFPDGTDGWVKIGRKIIQAKPIELPQMTRALTQ